MRSLPPGPTGRPGCQKSQDDEVFELSKNRKEIELKARNEILNELHVQSPLKNQTIANAVGIESDGSAILAYPKDIFYEEEVDLDTGSD